MWKLLGKYIVDVDYRAHRAGRSYTNYSLLIGAILTTFLSAEADAICEGFEYARLQNAKARLPRFFSPEQLDALAASSGVDVLELGRISPKRPAHPARVERIKGKRERTLRDLTRRPPGPLPGGPRGPKSLRGGGDGAVPAASVRSNQLGCLDLDGERPAGPSSVGLVEAQALLAWAQRKALECLEQLARGG